MDRITVGAPARLESAGILRAVVMELEPVFARQGHAIAPAVLRRWGLAIYEAATNVVRHGYGGGSDDTITLTIEVAAGAATFRLRDRGRPHPDFRRPPPHREGEGGFGMGILYDVMEAVSYQPSAQGANELYMLARG